ncbi:thioesterase family protein [Saccharopolyspora griseoalba]|uniref:Thioesterase family protein n=1 Tax=Saccharopolyspora griseoalba TaxID=1431848 RepID=A0ABW2LFZ7_9PSEU
MTATPPPAQHYFQRIGPERFRPTSRVGGAWREDEQHVSPLAGLITHAVETHREQRQAAPMALSRISFDILGQIRLEDFDLTVETTRPGRTIELLEASVIIGGRAVVRARAWFMAEADTSAVAGGEPDRMPAPHTLEPWPMDSVWPARGFISSIEARTVGEPQPGRTSAWMSTGIPLLDAEPVSTLASFVALVDTANGIAVRTEPTKWMFPNLDLTIHLHRRPEGAWTGLDTGVVFGTSGLGLTSTVLHDELGPVGRAEQTLTVRALEQ